MVYEKKNFVPYFPIQNSGVSNETIVGMSDVERRELFEKAYVSLCRYYCGEMDMITWDSRRMNEISYTTLYDTVTKPNRKPRKKGIMTL